MSVSIADQTAMDSAIRHLVGRHNPRGARVGWLVMASVLLEAWDLYSIAFVLVFIRQLYHPGALLLGLAAAGTQGGAVVGALAGGWLTDRVGRRAIFLATMIAFIVLALAQAVVPSIAWLAVVRLLLGVPLGSDIANGYAYLMEALPSGERERVGNRWQFMFAIGEVLTLAVIAIFLISKLPPEWIWRVTLGLGAVPALAILLLRRDLPETAVWLIRRGRFREAKAVSRELYADPLDMLPDRDPVLPASSTHEFLADLRRDRVRWRASLYGWIACFCQSTEFSTFAFYIPVLFVSLGVSSILGTDLVTMLLYLIAAVSGWLAPVVTPKLGHRGLAMTGFGIVLVSLVVAAGAIATGHNEILPFAAAAMLWGHYWDASNCMTIPSLVARPHYRGTASGFAYMFVKLPSFFAIFLFPTLFAAIGHAAATLFVALFSLVGLLAAIFVLPEVYGFEQD